MREEYMCINLNVFKFLDVKLCNKLYTPPDEHSMLQK